MVVDGFDNLIAVDQLINLYLHEHFGVNSILYRMQLTNAKCLHIARKDQRYSFDIGIEDIVIVALDLHYQHLRGSKVKDCRRP